MAGGNTGDHIVDCLPAHAVDIYSNPDACSHPHTVAYRCVPTPSNHGAYPNSDPNTFARTHSYTNPNAFAIANSHAHATAYRCAFTSSNPGAHASSNPNSYCHTYIGGSSVYYYPHTFIANSHAHAGATGTHIRSVLEPTMD